MKKKISIVVSNSVCFAVAANSVEKSKSKELNNAAGNLQKLDHRSGITAGGL